MTNAQLALLTIAVQHGLARTITFNERASARVLEREGLVTIETVATRTLRLTPTDKGIEAAKAATTDKWNRRPDAMCASTIRGSHMADGWRGNGGRRAFPMTWKGGE
jgi:hypothetical protein